MERGGWWQNSSEHPKTDFKKFFLQSLHEFGAQRGMCEETALPPIPSTSQKPQALEPLSGLGGQTTGEAEAEESISSWILS